MTDTNCVFCAITAGQSPAFVCREWNDAVAIRPRRGGVNEGHLLILPRIHVPDAGADPEVTAAVMRRAAVVLAGYPSANLITSKGKPATQSVSHLHVHVFPRKSGDGLALPWSEQQAAAAGASS